MVDRNQPPARRLEDKLTHGMNDPLVMLGQLCADVSQLKVNSTDNKATLEQLAKDVFELKLERAGLKGRDKAYSKLGNFGGFILNIAISFISVYIAFKALK